MKYSVNGHQPENNFLWDKSTILSKELMRSTKSHHALNKYHYIMELLDQHESNDMAGIQD